MVNQDPSYICRLINGRQRLSPDTARFYIKTAFEGKGIRWEWLAGLDDFKTEIEQIENGILTQGNVLQKENNEWRCRDEVVSKMLRALHYRWFKPNATHEDLRMEDETDEFMDFFFVLHNSEYSQTMREKFSEEGLYEMRKLCDRILWRNDAAFMDLFGDDYDVEDEDSNHWIASHPEEYLKNVKEYVRIEREERENTSWGLYDDDLNMVTVFSPNEYIAFVNQLYDVVTALIQYHITKKKGQA